MDNKFDYTETIENYIRGEMSGDQKLQFESQLNQDPLLKEEFQMQQDLIHSIQQVRRTELKARLDGVQIGIFDGISSTAGFKIVTTGLIATAIGVGSYFAFFNDSGETGQQVSSEQIAETTTPEVGEITDGGQKKSAEKKDPEKKDAKTQGEKETKTQPASGNETEKTDDSKASESTKSVETAKSDAKDKKVEQTKKEEENVDVIPVLPELDDNFAEEDSTPSNDIDVPDNELGPSVVETKSTFEIETNSDTKNHFHYRFKSGKLILYGDFSNSTYEIIELNSTLGKSYYLYYDENFYPLSVDNTKITELRVLTDKTLIEELKKIKGDN